LGDGIAVDPVEGRVVAPGAGVVSSIHRAGHAITLSLDSGPVVLIHIGLDTVALGGVGFTPRVKDGQRVGEGETLIEFDLDLLARKVPGSRLRLDHISRFFGEASFGPVTQTVTSILEGALFAAGVVSAMALAARDWKRGRS